MRKPNRASSPPNWTPVTPSYVASVLDRYPAQRAPLIALAQASYGSDFVRSVLSDSSFTEEDTAEYAPVSRHSPKHGGVDDA